MTDLSEFLKGERSGGFLCWYSRYPFTDEEREKIDAALASDWRVISGSKIAAVATGWGYPTSRSAVNSHRGGDCSCG